MRTRTLIGVVAAGLSSLAAPPIAHAQLTTSASQQRYVPGEAIVRFEPGVVAAERRGARSDAGVSFDESLRLPRAQVVEFDGSVREAIERLEDQPGVAYAQPNYRHHATAVSSNDTWTGLLWGLDITPGVDVTPAWARTRGAGQVIAILDTGVDLTHPDIAGNLWTGPGGIHGADFVDEPSSPDDEQYHGTHVAGSAAAIAGNGLGVAGVAPEAEIMAVRVLDGDGSGDTGTTIDGIDFASLNGAGVINMSLGGPVGPEGDQATQDAIARAEARGSVIVAAAGNEANDNDAAPFAPCALPNPNIVCVAAVDNQSELASYSNFGAASVDVGAPGGDDAEPGDVEILSSKPAYLTKFDEDFEDVTDWTPSGTPPGWGLQNLFGDGDNWGADSPNAQYADNVDSELAADSPTSLNGNGCRIRFDFAIDTTADPDDFMTVGVDTGSGLLAEDFRGGELGVIEASTPQLDGQSVTPLLQFSSDGATVDTGGFVDDFRLACRGGAPGDYDDDVVDADLFDLSAGTGGAGGGSYMEISGTSMATPHVSGVAALVRAADPGVTPSQVVRAIRSGATGLSSLAGRTVTGGTVNAGGAIEAALAEANQPPPPSPPALPAAPGKARFGRISVTRRGVVRLVLRGDRNTRGVATLRANITRPSAARIVRVARKSFLIGSTGRVTVRLRLSRPALRQLRRTRRLALRARVVLTNAAGLKSTATARLRIRLRRR